MTEKRKPTLADFFINKKFTNGNNYGISLKLISFVQNEAKKATKFVFTDEATRQVANVIRDMPDLLVRESGLVRAPYDNTWFEFNRPVLWRQIYRDDPDRLSRESSDSSFLNGVLIAQNFVFLIVGGSIENESDLSNNWITPFSYQLHEPHGPGAREFFPDLDLMFWGSTMLQLPIETILEMSANFSVAPIVIRSNFELLQKLSVEFYGDLRNIIAFLLMMNRPAITSFSNAAPKHRGWIKNKFIPYASHHTVTINLDPKPTLAMLGTAGESGVHKRRHEVRGHYAHDETTRDYGAIGCLHDWQTTNRWWHPITISDADLPLHGVCKICNGKRWWRNEHERGDESLGRITHDYTVNR